MIERWRGRRTRFPNPGCFPTRLENRNRDFAVLRNPLRRHNWLTSGRAARNPDPSESRRAKRPISAPDADASFRPWSRAARQRAAQTLQIKPETTPPPAKVAPPLSPERAFPIRASAGGLEAELVGFAVHVAAAYSAAGQPDGETRRVCPATRDGEFGVEELAQNPQGVDFRLLLKTKKSSS